ncbi:MAG TPA: SDR family NAD(P)-dependent oxidoreductase [Solirubrobacteraceae bacterium]|jgi:short-subunit dehydrogenase|nr:SDR family NAD(P)-dependent oxidoreductase [Solirubrobacteraceae bacterium]
MAQWDGRTVLVTGASRGIGMATAEQFAALGARVGLVARSAEPLEAMAARLGDRAHAVTADLSDPAEAVRAVAEVEEALGPVDVLISCAGVLHRDWVEDVVVEDFEESYRLGVGGALWLTQQVLPGMRERGFGRIVLVSSELGLLGGPTYASYCTTKFALVGLAEVLHQELRGSGVRACAVCPGDVRTSQLEEEHAWGPTGGVTPDKAMDPARVARDIEAAARGSSTVVVIDRAHLRLVFKLMGGPRKLRLLIIADAFKKLLKARKRPSVES